MKNLFYPTPRDRVRRETCENLIRVLISRVEHNIYYYMNIKGPTSGDRSWAEGRGTLSRAAGRFYVIVMCQNQFPDVGARSIYIAYTRLHRPRRHSFASLSSQKTKTEECRPGGFFFFFNLSNFDFLFSPFFPILDRTTFPAVTCNAGGSPSNRRFSKCLFPC